MKLPVEVFREGGTAFLLHLPRHRSSVGSTESGPQVGRSGEPCPPADQVRLASSRLIRAAIRLIAVVMAFASVT